MKKRLTRAVTAIRAAAFVLATIPAPEVEAALPSYTETFTGNIDEKIATEPEIKGVAVSFKADFDTLLYKVNTQYQPEVSKFCSILATDVYETTKVTLDGYKDNPTSGNDDLKLVKAFGFTDPQSLWP